MSDYDRLIDGAAGDPEENNGASKGKRPPTIQPKLIRVSDVEPEDVRWLWPGRIAIGKLSIIAGDPGLGKSFLTLDIIARVTRGCGWPDGSAGVSGSAILIAGEDDIADTIRPRLDAADADCSRVQVLEGVTIPGDDDTPDRELSMSLLTDLPALERALDQLPDCRLIVIDPLSSYLGAETDSHKNADVRSVLAPLGDLAKRRSVAIVCVEHLNKRQGGSAAYRMQGSIAFAATARVVWYVVKDRSNSQLRLFLPVKNNLGNDTDGLGFQLVAQPGQKTPCLSWSADPVTQSIDEAMESPPQRRPPTATDDAAEWLQGFLSDGPKRKSEVDEAGEADGHSPSAIRKAKQKLGIDSRKAGMEGGWLWQLPEVAPPGPDSARGSSSAPSGETREIPSKPTDPNVEGDSPKTGPSSPADGFTPDDLEQLGDLFP